MASASLCPGATDLPLTERHKIQYRHATVPVAAAHNATFGAIEERVFQGAATAHELCL